MKGKIWAITLVMVLLSVLVPTSFGKGTAEDTFKEQERYTVSLELEFAPKNQRSLQRVVSYLLDSGTNGYATGFLLGDGLVMTADHVVSGELSESKKVILGFSRHDELAVKVSVNGRQATVIGVDKEEDRALLAIE